MEIDIRKVNNDNVDTIRVCDPDNQDFIIGDIVFKDKGFILIKDSADDAYFVSVLNKEHALNLIKGLEKVIELGWVK